MDFYYMAGSAPCRSVMMVAKTLGIDLNMKPTNLRAGEHLKPEFVKLNPQHTIPTLVDNGLVLWESRAILIYLVEMYGKTDSLYPKNVQKRALVNQRLYFDMGTLYQSFGDYIYPVWLHNQPKDPEKFKKLEQALELLNTLLDGQTFAVGDSLTIADIAFLATISTFEMADVDLSKYVNIGIWYENVKQVTPGWAENWEAIIEVKKAMESKM